MQFFTTAQLLKTFPVSKLTTMSIIVQRANFLSIGTEDTEGMDFDRLVDLKSAYQILTIAFRQHIRIKL